LFVRSWLMLPALPDLAKSPSKSGKMVLEADGSTAGVIVAMVVVVPIHRVYGLDLSLEERRRSAKALVASIKATCDGWRSEERLSSHARHVMDQILLETRPSLRLPNGVE